LNHVNSLEFLEIDKETMVCLNFVDYMPNEPMPNESLELSNKLMLHLITTRFVNPIHIVVMVAFVSFTTCKSWTYFVLGQASDLKRENVGGKPSFTDHEGREN
jgi:hypothetical protein